MFTRVLFLILNQWQHRGWCPVVGENLSKICCPFLMGYSPSIKGVCEELKQENIDISILGEKTKWKTYQQAWWKARTSVFLEIHSGLREKSMLENVVFVYSDQLIRSGFIPISKDFYLPFHVVMSLK